MVNKDANYDSSLTESSFCCLMLQNSHTLDPFSDFLGNNSLSNTFLLQILWKMTNLSNFSVGFVTSWHTTSLCYRIHISGPLMNFSFINWHRIKIWWPLDGQFNYILCHANGEINHCLLNVTNFTYFGPFYEFL